MNNQISLFSDHKKQNEKNYDDGDADDDDGDADVDDDGFEDDDDGEFFFIRGSTVDDGHGVCSHK